MKQRRLLTLAAGTALLFLIWSFFHQSEDDVLQTREVQGRIIEIHQKRSPNRATKRETDSKSIVIAVVEINGATTTDGGHARVLIKQGQYEVGDEVPLILKLYKDGSRKVILAPKVMQARQTGAGERNP